MTHPGRTLLRSGLVAPVCAAMLALVGCAGNGLSDLDPRLETAKSAFGGGFDYVYVPSSGRLADEAFVAMSRVAGPREISRDLASTMAPAETQPVRVLVTGPSDEKTVQVVLDALSFYQGRQIPHLELLYLGDPAHEGRLAKELAAVGAVLRFAPYSE